MQQNALPKAHSNYSITSSARASSVGRARLSTKPEATGVVRQQKHDRDRRGGPLCHEGSVCCRDDDIDLQPHQFGGDLGEALGVSFRPVIFDRDGM